MAIAESGPPAHTGSAMHPELPTLLAQAEELLHGLQTLQQACGTYLEQLATVDWAGLAQQGKLAGIPKFTIERTIIDARNVLNNGLQHLANILQLARQPVHDQAAMDDVVARLRALIRLYADTPTDIHNRHQRLLGWVEKIDQAMQQRGEVPLTAQMSLPRPAT